MFSRLYLGVHSPADIVAGGIIGCIILAYWIKIDSIVDRSISFGDNGMYCHSVSTAWSNKGYCFSPLPPLDGMQATLCQASLALIVQIESHTTVRGKFLEQVGTTEALPGSWTWTCQFRVYNNNADIEQFIKVIWYTVYCSLCTQLNEKLTH